MMIFGYTVPIIGPIRLTASFHLVPGNRLILPQLDSTNGSFRLNQHGFQSNCMKLKSGQLGQKAWLDYKDIYLVSHTYGFIHLNPESIFCLIWSNL